MVDHIRTVLSDLGYIDIMETTNSFSMTPKYRESDSKTVLCMYKTTGKWIDFKFGTRGNIYDFIRLHKIDNPEEWLTNRQIPFVAETRSCIKVQGIFEKSLLTRLVKDHSYWEGRGISSKVTEKFQGGISTKAKMAGRYVFPVFNARDDIIGFVGRDLTDKSNIKVKILGEKSGFVFSAKLNQLAIRRKRKIILVEGIPEGLTLSQCGFDNWLVCFGTSLGKALLGYLLRMDPKQIVISLNNDALDGGNAGNIASETMKGQLRAYFDEEQIQILLPKTKKDWNKVLVENGKEEILEAFSET